MGIESEHTDRNLMYQLYNNFSDCLSEEDKKKLKKIENYCGHQALMEIFVKCYYLDISGSWAGNEVRKRSKVHWIEGPNWNCIVDSYSSFRIWFSRNPDLQQKIIDLNYGSIHNEVLSCCGDNSDVKGAYLSWEDYLSEEDAALKAWKEIHGAFGPKTIVKFRKDMSRILEESDVYNPDSEAFKLSQEQGSAKSDEQTIYKIVVNKLLSDYGYALEERKSNRITRDRRYLRERLLKIISCYKKWSQHREKQEEILKVMMESNYGPGSDTIVVDGEVVPNSQKLNRGEYGGELQDKECHTTEKVEEVGIQSKQDPKVKDQPKQLELFAEEKLEGKSEKSQQVSQKPQQEAGEKQGVVDVPVIRAIEIDRGEKDDGDDNSIPSWHRWTDI